MSTLSGLYGRVARARRAWYQQADRQLRLGRPVISIGNLVVGGSGKTPVVASVAQLLQEAGERPAILSRGYARRSKARVVVVNDGTGMAVSASEAGDEPCMLARALPEVPLVVCASRYEAGRVAEARFGATVHLLDDGFQHIRLARDIDLLLVSGADLEEAVLPSGRLREPLDAARDADALLVPGSAADAARVGDVLGVTTTFSLTPSRGALRVLAPFTGGPASTRGTRVVAVAGIARPARFFDDLRVDGFDVAQSFAFRDHHWFTPHDVQVACDAALALGAAGIVTTEKDAVRLEPLLERAASLGSLPWACVPYSVRVEPADRFRTWLLGRLAHVRRSTSMEPA